MEGWIKLHRKFLNWEFYDDINTKVLFLHLLLNANYEDKKWRGIVIKRGQLVTSREHLAKQVGLSIQQVRTSLDKLENNQQITRKTTNKFTLITIEKYGLYQSYDDFITNKQPATQPTNNHNIRNIKNKKNNIYEFQKNQNEDFGSLYEN